MLKTKKQKLAIILLLILVCIYLIIAYTKSEKDFSPIPIKQENINNTKDQTKNKEIFENNVFLEISGVKYGGIVADEVTIYDFMNNLRANGTIVFKEKNFTGMGKFIEEINGVGSNNQKYWIYYVNGVKAKTGISNYKIKPGDVVSWKLEDY